MARGGWRCYRDGCVVRWWPWWCYCCMSVLLAWCGCCCLGAVLSLWYRYLCWRVVGGVVMAVVVLLGIGHGGGVVACPFCWHGDGRRCCWRGWCLFPWCCNFVSGATDDTALVLSAGVEAQQQDPPYFPQQVLFELPTAMQLVCDMARCTSPHMRLSNT